MRNRINASGKRLKTIFRQTGNKLKKLLLIICISIFICGISFADENTVLLPNEISLKAVDFEFSSDMRNLIADGNVQVKRGDENITADKVNADLITGDIIASGNVTVTRISDKMTADKANANLISGDVAATGNVRFKSADRSLEGQSFTYNYHTQQGIASDVTGQAGALYFKGKTIAFDTGRLDLKKSTFTTCDKVKPHYRIQANEIILEPGKRLVAKNASIYILSAKLFTVPRYGINLTKGKNSRGSLPSVGYNKFGYSISYKFDLNQGPETDSSLDIMLSTKFGLLGGLYYDEINGHPYFARAAIHELVYGSTPRLTIVSRLPEVGIRLNSDPSLQDKPVNREQLTLDHQLLDPDAKLLGKMHLNTVSEFSLGRYIEKQDTNVQADRGDARVLVSYDPLKRGSQIVISPAVFARYSVYNNLKSYGVGGIKLGAGKKIGNSYLTAAYIAYSTSGRTPFDFDKIEVKDEIVGGLHANISGTKIYLAERYDVKKNNIYDTTLVISRTFHCIESSLTWRGRFKDVSFDVKLAGF